MGGDCPANHRESTDRCTKCFESVTLIQPQYKGGAFKGPAKGQCLNCMDGWEYDLTVPVNRRDLIHAIEVVTLKADVHLTASIGRNRPKADKSPETLLSKWGAQSFYPSDLAALIWLRNSFIGKWV